MDKKVKVIYIIGIIALLGAIMVMPVSAVTLSSDGDSTLRELSPSSNEGNKPLLSTKSTIGDRCRALVHFDFSTIPSGATINSATLRLYIPPWNHCGIDGTHNVHRIEGEWTETGVTWNNQPSINPTPTDSKSTGTATNVWIEWDVTSDVQDFVGDTYNYGWMVKYAEEGTAGKCVLYASRESSPEPELVVEYTVAPEIGCVGATQTFTCGETVTESCTFNGNMSCPAGRGLKIGADDITIDGAGFTLDGVSPGDACTASGVARTGIYISPSGDEEERNNIVIKNLNVKSFCNGIFLRGDEDYHVVNNTIENCRVYDNGRNVAGVKSNGITLIFVYESTIENCKIYNNTGGEGCTPPCENGGSGIFMYAGNDNVITNNDIYDNKKGGFFTKAKPMRNEISHNEVWGNHQGGIIVRCKCSQNLTIEYNNVSYNYGTGIFIGGPCNTIRHNKVCNNMNGAIEGLPDTGTNGCGVNFGRSDNSPGCGPGGSCGSRYNSLINNTICDNEYLDIWERAAVCGTNNGVENKCDEPDGWNDDGVIGCTYSCTAPPEPNATVYLEPENSSASYCNETEVEIWANTSDPYLAGGTVNLTYDAGCANVTNFVRDGAWEIGVWNSGTEGRELITFMSTTLKIGEVLIGTLTVHCVNESMENCTTGLVFDEGSMLTSKPPGESAVEIDTAWENGSFACANVPVQEQPDLVIVEKTEDWVSLAEKTYGVTYTVRNVGDAEAGASNTTIYVDGTAVMEDAVPALAAGANYTNTVGPFTMSGANDTIKVCADNGEVVAESDETNNCVENVFEYEVIPEYTVKIGEYTINLNSDGEVTVPVEILNATDVAGGSVNISFDSSIVEVQTVTSGHFGTSLFYIDNTNGFVRVAAAGTTAVGMEEAVLANILFKGTSEGHTDLNIRDALLNFEDGTTTTPAAIPGSITVERYMQGDLNHNNVIDTGDATLVLRMVVGLATADMLGDMNGNGMVDTGDATLILRTVVGL